MKFIKLTEFDFKKPIWVNANYIMLILSSDNYTVITYHDDEDEKVVETPEEILALINGPAENTDKVMD